jgi:hypothetical protein
MVLGNVADLEGLRMSGWRESGLARLKDLFVGLLLGVNRTERQKRERGQEKAGLDHAKE